MSMRAANVRFFLDAPWKTREARLFKRESAASMQQFYGRLIPLENAYFETYRLPNGDVLLIENRSVVSEL